jgi:hypothetical protein
MEARVRLTRWGESAGLKGFLGSPTRMGFRRAYP